MKVYKIADFVGGIVKFRDDFPYRNDVIAMLRDFPREANAPPELTWKIATGVPELYVNVQPSVSVSDAVQEPIFFPVRQLVLYCNQLFVAENLPKTAGECGEVVIEVKKRVRGETAEPTKPMSHPPGVPEGYVQLWVHPQIA